MSFIPPFCPYKECSRHYEGSHPHHWYRKYGHHSTRTFGPVQRYRCNHCGRTFSTQSFSLDYYVKRRIDYEQIFRQLRSTAGIRDLARNLEISRGSVQNRLLRMSRWSIALHALARETVHLSEDLVSDGFESFLRSKYYPHHLNILIGKNTEYFYAMDFATLRRKGRMSSAQRLYREFLDKVCRPDPKGIEKSMARLAEEVVRLFFHRKGKKHPLTLYTDEHQAYPRAFQHHPVLKKLLCSGQIIHYHSLSTKEPGRSNVMWVVNYIDRQLRKDIVNYVRRTVNVAKNVNKLLERLSVYRMYHNYIKAYRENSPKDGRTHGMLAGCDMDWVNELLQRRFRDRPFASMLPLSPGDRGVWFRLYRTPLKWGEEYRPKYLYG